MRSHAHLLQGATVMRDAFPSVDAMSLMLKPALQLPGVPLSLIPTLEAAPVVSHSIRSVVRTTLDLLYGRNIDLLVPSNVLARPRRYCADMTVGHGTYRAYTSPR